MYITQQDDILEIPIADIFTGDLRLSETNKKGVTYSHYFTKDQDEIEKNKQRLEIIPKNKEDQNKDNQFLFATGIRTSDNFNGKLFEIEAQKQEDEFIFSAGIEVDENSSNHDVVYSFNISCGAYNKNCFLLDENNDPYCIGTLGNHPYYYLQYEKLQGACLLARNKNDYYNYYEFVNNKHNIINSKKFLGNLCLYRKSDLPSDNIEYILNAPAY
jgi:hypothetical protein